MARMDVQQNVLDSAAERLGAALRLHRDKLGLTLEGIAKRLNYTYTPVVLQMVESGRYPLESAQAIEVLHGYEADPDMFVQAKELSESDDDQGGIERGQTLRTANRSITAEGLLYEYLDFLYEVRGVVPGSVIPLREPDLLVLSSTIDWSVAQIQDHLTTLMSQWHDAELPDSGSPSHTRVSTLLTFATRSDPERVLPRAELELYDWAANPAPQEDGSDHACNEPSQLGEDEPANGAETGCSDRIDPRKNDSGEKKPAGKKKHTAKKKHTENKKRSGKKKHTAKKKAAES